MQLISGFNEMWYTIEEQPFKYFWYRRQNTYGSIIIGIRFSPDFHKGVMVATLRQDGKTPESVIELKVLVK